MECRPYKYLFLKIIHDNRTCLNHWHLKHVRRNLRVSIFVSCIIGTNKRNFFTSQEPTLLFFTCWVSCRNSRPLCKSPVASVLAEWKKMRRFNSNESRVNPFGNVPVIAIRPVCNTLEPGRAFAKTGEAR